MVFEGYMYKVDEKWEKKKKKKKKKKKTVVPDLRVDRFSVQYAKAVSKLSSNRPYFYDQSWL